MPVNLSIKNAPDLIVERLRRRAARNHRSLQGELMAIIEAAALTEPPNEVLDRARPARPPPASAPTVTDVKVVDASAVAALLFGEPEADAIALRLDGARLVAPSLLGVSPLNLPRKAELPRP